MSYNHRENGYENQYAQGPNNAGSDLQAAMQADIAERANRKRKRWLVVFIIALVVLVASLVALGVIAFSYMQGQQKYAQIADTADVDASGFSENADIRTLTVDWDALRKANPDTVAWVYVPGTVINYPIVQGKDNEHYLYYDFDGDAGWLADYGAVFLDYQNKPNWTDPSYFIYGHHMNDGSMFADIANMQDQERFDKSRIVYLLTPKGNFRLRSFSLVHCSADEPIVMTSFSDKKEMTSYIQDKIDRSIVKTGTIPKAKDITKSFAFATCDNYSSGRYVLFTYVLDTSVSDLAGEVGIKEGDDGASSFVDDLETQDSSKQSDKE